MLDFLKPLYRRVRQVASFRKELPHQTVGIFVRATLPSTIGLREIYAQGNLRCQLLVFGELFTIVQGQRLSQSGGQGLKQLFDRLANGRRPSVGNLAQQQVARFSVHQRDGSATVSLADHRVALPVAVACPAIDRRRTPFDRDASRQLAAIFRASPHAPQASQVAAPVGSSGLLDMDPSVNRLPRDVAARMVGKTGAVRGRAGDSTRVVIITGNGKSFCAGADLKYFKESASTLGQQEARYRWANKTMMNPLAQFSKPVIAAINGACLGGGYEIMLACDLAVAAEDAVIADQQLISASWGPASTRKDDLAPRAPGRPRDHPLGKRLTGKEACRDRARKPRGPSRSTAGRRRP